MAKRPSYKARSEALIEALRLASNRLSLHAVNAIVRGDPRATEYQEWAEDARASSKYAK